MYARENAAVGPDAPRRDHGLHPKMKRLNAMLLPHTSAHAARYDLAAPF
jgi:hypothetical protein